MSLLTEVAQHLHNQSVGTLATNLFYANLPETPDAAIAVLDTGGTRPDEELPTKEPTFQIFIRSTTYSAGKTKLDAVRTALHQKKNTQLVPSGTYFYFILAISEGGHLGRDENQRDLFSINFRCRTR